MRCSGSVKKTRGDITIQGLWEIQMESIIDVRFGDSDTDTWKTDRMGKLLDQWAKIKKERLGSIATTSKIKYQFFYQFMELWARRTN